jgi:uncharacterized membrane protein
MVALLLKLLHIVTAFLFIAGLLGRTLVMWQASRTTDVRGVDLLVRLAGYFERWMVIPGSMCLLGSGLILAWVQRWQVLGGSYWLLISTGLYISMIPIIAFIFIPRGKIFARSLEKATAIGQVTMDLTAAFHDRIVRIAHAYELCGTAVIILLMVTKPF